MSGYDTDEAFGKIDFALRSFWKAANALSEDAAQDEINEALIDPADQVLLMHKDILATEAVMNAQWYPQLAEHVERMRAFLDEKNVTLMPQAQITSTGRETFRPLVFKKFDL